MRSNPLLRSRIWGKMRGSTPRVIESVSRSAIDPVRICLDRSGVEMDVSEAWSARPVDGVGEVNGEMRYEESEDGNKFQARLENIRI
ncbi:hypothetical protein M413DRAFT_146853 [Hebeloma cylindrosporum]|uniref:Uncharacterized protein n=1 Tax=Hebeloma cylindrosporum TaxID=76867 RepID=A0A0C3BXL8_HEBCY|nr:hypothetical protein M413DRAFT_146853 [Hebeloma cylindrosporum h7]